MPDSGLVQCRLCPKECRLLPGERGDCRVRVNLHGKLITLVYAKACALHVDPIEKKPLFHFLPGSSAFSVATAGCNLHCLNCQNWDISQADPENVDNIDLQPAQLVAEAVAHRCRTIAYTYTDPIIFYEYALDSCREAGERGLYNVLITAGFINPKPMEELAQVSHGANVDLKAFSDGFYRKITTGRLKPVLNAITTLRRHGVWVEITNLVIPTMNDGDDMVREMCGWIMSELGPDVPLHLSRFFPRYKMKDLPRTPASTLRRLRDLALSEGLHHVYIGNLGAPDSETTYCPSCGRKAIVRRGYTILENNIAGGHCSGCGEAIAGVWR